MKIKSFLSLFTFLFSVAAFAQPSQDYSGQIKVDGVAAVVGEEVILDSDIERDYAAHLAQGGGTESKCDFMENILLEKMLVTQAKQDTLISVSDDMLAAQVDGTIQNFLTQGSEKDILEYFGYNTMTEFKQDLRGIMRNNNYAQTKQEFITEGTDATPEEVREFYEKYKDELPAVPDEVGLSHIAIYPEYSEATKQAAIDKLKEIKKDVEEGSSFSTKAILYSEDPGSASKGGEIKNVKRGQMVPEFDAVAFNLEEGEISEPFRTDFGYHIVQLDKRRGQELDLKHVLVRLKPNTEEIAEAKLKLDSIVNQIEKGEITFKEAAFKYSVDKYTKFNGGKITETRSGEDQLNREKLPPETAAAIAGLEVGDISQPFEDELSQQPVLRIIKLDATIPTHKMNMQTDYSRLKDFTINTKKQEVLMKYIEEHIPDTFINIGKDYSDCEFRMNWRKE